ncbi:MAG: hypothetical protein U1E14_11120 [Geminicoccaceae bacterium]
MAELAELLGNELGLRVLFELQGGPSAIGELARRCGRTETCLAPLLESLRQGGIVQRRDDRFSLGSDAVQRLLRAFYGIEEAGSGLGAGRDDGITLH